MAKQKKKLSPAQKAAKKKRQKEYMTIFNRSQDYNARFTATHRTVSVYRVLQMRGGGCADVLPVLQVPDNKADAVPCERLRPFL
ncbi:MAG: hypothetical protein LWX01_11705 [Deltaproteobacteria bacterium]|nr:hypothetical protein [Deltaproteobacteria bacterium]